MFKDYYQLLGISPSASLEEIKHAYRAMSLKWHPDKNPNVDVKNIMQDINEAYRILKNDITRERYDKEYQIFTQQQEKKKPERAENMSESWNYGYNVKDEDLKNDINEARAYAKDLVDEFFKNLRETSKAAAKGAWEGAYMYIIGGVIVSFFFALIRACH